MIYYVDPSDMIYGETKKNAVSYMKLPSGGVWCVEELEKKQVRMLSLYSTDPQDYLDTRFRPGQVYDMDAVFRK